MSLIHHVESHGRTLLSKLRSEARCVLWTPQGARLGNFLYFWLHAYVRRAEGATSYRVRYAPTMDPWLAIWPTLYGLTTPTTTVHWRAQRELPGTYYCQRWGVDFTPEHLEGFIRHHLLNSPRFQKELAAVLPLDPTTVVINVRRGDYYSDPKFRGLYSYDISAYLHAALATIPSSSASISTIHVVSDDIDWCRERLGWLAGRAMEVIFCDSSGSPLTDFARICVAPRLILPNSTFSFWAAYVRTALRGEPDEVRAPDFFDRSIRGGRPWQLDPAWTLVTNISGGWDS